MAKSTQWDVFALQGLYQRLHLIEMIDEHFTDCWIIRASCFAAEELDNLISVHWRSIGPICRESIVTIHQSERRGLFEPRSDDMRVMRSITKGTGFSSPFPTLPAQSVLLARFRRY